MELDQVIYQFSMGLPGLLLAVVCHEYAHGWMAYKFGDPTAKFMGRLTLNPLVHIDVLGSIIVPILGAFLGGVLFGWAKPVPIDPRHFKNWRQANFWVSFAGPLANFILVIISTFLVAFFYTQLPPTFYLYEPLIQIFKQSAFINALIGFFNLIPFPPLDGSNMVLSFLGPKAQRQFESLSRFSIIFFLIIMFTGITRYIVYPAELMTQFFLSSFFHFMLPT
jgi:Zn-dependent protease